jgi:hypothetical protein
MRSALARAAVDFATLAQHLPSLLGDPRVITGNGTGEIARAQVSKRTPRPEHGEGSDKAL